MASTPTRSRAIPDLRVERRLLRTTDGPLCALDEVGRGALAGPVTVGAVLIGLPCPPFPAGLRDSKLLTPTARQRLVPSIRSWATDWAVGQASAAEIDRHGIINALALAARRAIEQLETQPTVVLLDGNHDWLTDPESPDAPRVVTRVKSDLECASVAAASVLAKTHRDAVMQRLADKHPCYDWSQNKGYASPRHIEAISTHGLSRQHRRTWRIPGVPATPSSQPKS